jgi:hypothetical protein
MVACPIGENAMNPDMPKITVIEVTDPVENAKAHERREKFNRNYAWLEAHADEVFRHRGTYVCIAGQELFVGDDIVKLLARAKAAHPDDEGPLFQYVPKEKAARIYAHRRSVAGL